MAGLIGMVIFLLFSFVWYYPLYKEKPAEKKPAPKLFWKAFFMGLGPAFLVGLVLPICLGWILKAFQVGSGTLTHKIVVDGIGYGVGEELSKFLIAWLILRKDGFKNPAYTSLLFGAVGLGFGVFESFLAVTNIPSAFVRGFFCLHVFFQLWMGLYYGEYLEKKNAGDSKFTTLLVLAFAIPMLVHACHDVVGSLGLEMLSTGEETKIVTGLALFLAAVAVDVVFVLVTRKKVKKS